MGIDELDGPSWDFPRQYLWPPTSGPDYSECRWLHMAGSLGFSLPDTTSLGPVRRLEGGTALPLGVPISDVYQGQNGWPRWD